MKKLDITLQDTDEESSQDIETGLACTYACNGILPFEMAEID